MFPDQLHHYDIILASKSPRRKELLTLAGIPFRTITKEASEHFTDGSDPADVVMMLCLRKASMYEEVLKDDKVVVITADTIVVCDNQIINKPSGEAEAFSMLNQLSGKVHEVLTGVCIRHRNKSRSFYERTRVEFRPLNDDEIWHYIRTSRPFDKAGAYGIQEWIGHIGIVRIEGSYPNVVGLPVHRVYQELLSLLNIHR